MGKDFKPLTETYPEISSEAFGWNPELVTHGSNTNAEWKCSKGHIWTAKIVNRTLGKTGCPYCSGKRVTPGENDLGTTHPELAKEAFGWDPQNVSKGSMKKLKWICPKGHVWESTVNQRTNRKSNCSVCDGKSVIAGINDLKTLYPEIADQAYEWDPSTLTPGSGKKVWWKCNEGHTWEAPPERRTSNNSGCPYCSNHFVLKGFNDLGTSDPKVAGEAFGWDPSTVTRSSDKYKEWSCSIGHVYTARIANRVNNESDCPYCSGNKILVGFNDLATTHPHLAAEALDWNPTKYSFGAGAIVKWKCNEGHTWKASVASRASVMQTNCPSCAATGFDPNEDGFFYFLKHADWKLLQIGITNQPKQRLNKHARLGWELIEIRGPMDGQLTRQWETECLRYLRNLGIELGPKTPGGKFDGYSETWKVQDFDPKSIVELFNLVRDLD
jgi:uncharacterized Zn-finger protein